MEAEDRKKFVCKYCKKRYRCGKSLGGHLRSHRTGHETATIPPNRTRLNLNQTTASEAATYVLRENPKKTNRFGDSRVGGGAPPPVERFCKECGKGFRSMKALCGHMACHAMKLGSESETETETAPFRKRSDFNGSSSDSEIEVAMCLMMLSRDCGYGDNNSVVLENSDSGYFRNGAKKLKSDVSADGFEFDFRFNTLKGKNKPGFGFFEPGKQIKAKEPINYAPIYRNSLKRINDHELWEVCHKRIENGTASIDKSCNIARKIIEFEGVNSIEADSFIDRSKVKGKKSKGHECPICFRVFKSGQALGGHKRSHFIGGSDGRTVLVIAKQQVSRLLDLNLPAPDEEEGISCSWQC